MSHFPITITHARYGGAYEGGEWVAFQLAPGDIPDEAFADDVACVSWWLEHGDGVGKGSTPEEARDNLVSIEDPLQLIRSRGDRQPRIARARRTR